MKIEEAIKWIRARLASGPTMDEAYKAGLMAIEALKETQWISVTDRLPEKPGYYMIYVEGFLPAISWFDEKCWGLRKVTHWKPLPKAPEV